MVRIVLKIYIFRNWDIPKAWLGESLSVLLWSLSDGDDRIGGNNQNPKESVGLPTKPQKILGPKMYPPKIQCRKKKLVLWMPQKMSTKINPPQKVLAKFSFPKISRNRKFQTQKNASIIPSLKSGELDRKPSKHQLFNKFTVLNLPSKLNFMWNWKSFFFRPCLWRFAIVCLQTHAVSYWWG